jgi:hypothetical protein
MISFSSRPNQTQTALQESQSLKAEANTLFSNNDIHNALSTYEDALLPLPRSAHFPRAVLHSNISACHLRLEQPKDAAKAATAALDELTKLETNLTEAEKKIKEEEEEVEEEIVSSGAENSAPAAPKEGDIKADIARIRTKSLLRRARAYATTSPASWHALSSAQADYQALAALPAGQLTPSDARTVRIMLRELEPKVKVAQEREMGEMWGKLKDLGDGLLKPFGLSTSNFQMVKDEKTGGYSMNFQQGPAK